jgi:anti-sigma factor RsiW
LTEPEREAAERHLAGCPACRDERDTTARMQGLVAGLLLLDPPAAALVSVARRPRAHLWVGVAAALLGVTVLASSPSERRARPQLVQTMAFTSIPVALGTVVSDQAPRALVAPFRAPGQLAGGYQLVAVLHRRGVVQCNYRDGLHQLSVFEQSGDLDADRLPVSRQPVDLGSVRGVSYAWMDGDLLTWQSGPTTYTVMGDAPADDILAAARSIPPGRPLALIQRVRITSRGLLEELTGRR